MQFINRLTQFIALAVLLIAGNGLAAPAPTMTKTEFRDAMDKLWDDHVIWTRLYIVSAAADLPDKDATAQPLLQNQTDLGDAIKPIYGEAAGEKLTGLLKDHIMISTEIIDAAKAGDIA